MNALVKRPWPNASPLFKSAIRGAIPFVSVAMAGVVNVFLMRMNELRYGIDVKDEKGQVVGKSPKAGFIAISQVALSRVATAFPALTIPPLIVAALERPLLSRVPILRTPLNLGKNPTFVFKPHCSRFPIDPSR